VVFVCENNRYAMGTALAKEHGATDLAARVASYGLPSRAVDGMDVEAVEVAAREAVDAARAGKGPQFLEMRTSRFRAHSMYDADRYRTKEEIQSWRDRGPIRTLEDRMRKDAQLAQDDLTDLEADVAEIIRRAIDFADAAPLEPIDQLTRFVMTEEVSS
jgi:pyruvate dehydrogenase E1 component alpha subunit